MGTLVAIGGGRLSTWETARINQAIVRLTGRKRPRALFIPTASGEPRDYIEFFHTVYGKRLGCRVEVLYLLKKQDRPSAAAMKRMILAADLIYVGGGNTLRMLKLWRKLGIDRWLKQAYANGTVCSGLSAGAICWFRYGSSDSRRFSNPKNWSLIRLKGLDFIPATASPHHLREKNRRGMLVKIMQRTPGVGLALDDCAAIIIKDGGYRVLATKSGATVHRVFRRNGSVQYLPVVKSQTFKPLKDLLSTDRA